MDSRWRTADLRISQQRLDRWLRSRVIASAPVATASAFARPSAAWLCARPFGRAVAIAAPLSSSAPVPLGLQAGSTWAWYGIFDKPINNMKELT